MTTFSEAMAQAGFSPYPEQEIMAERLIRDTASDSISLVEAPPATGKTHVLAWHAARLARDTGQRVLVAVPSVALLRQTVEVIRTMAESFGGVEVAPVYGRQEFVDDIRLRAWLSAMHPDAYPVYEEWAALQDERGWNRNSLDMALIAAGHDLDLPDEASLITRRSGPAYAAYSRQFETPAQIVVATHAFLARDTAARIGRTEPEVSSPKDIVEANERRLAAETADDRILPVWDHLIVDEAHLLPGGFTMALTTRISFHRLLEILTAMQTSGVAIPEKSLSGLRKAVDVMQAAAPRGIGRTMRLSADQRHHMALIRGVESSVPQDLEDLDWDDDELRYLQRFRDSAVMAARYRRISSPGLSWSDVHARLSLTIAPVHLFRQMDYLWRGCRSAALFSATLHAADDEDPSEQIIRHLGLPAGRCTAHDVFDADWTTTPVVLHLPDAGYATDLRPDSPERASALAGTIELAASESATGMLALFTSHSSIEEMADMLDDDLGSRIMTTGDQGVHAAAMRFIRTARAGGRPVWLATGPTWTGLDLPSDVIDTLLVGRLPYGLVNPVLHQHLLATVKTKVGFRDGETDMLRMLDQGIGRLVRSRNLTQDRKLWIADGRIVEHRAGARAAARLARYRRRITYG